MPYAAVVQNQVEEPSSQDEVPEDIDRAAHLHRGLSPFMNFAFGFTEVGVLSSICVVFGHGLSLGGTATFFWTYLVNFLLTIITGYCMAELCAAYPSAGACYQWAGQIAPKELAPLMSYITGWCNFTGNAAGDAAFANGFSSMLCATLVACGFDAISISQQVLISMIVLFAWTVLNFFRVDQVGFMNNIAAAVHIGSIVIIIIVCLAMTPRLATANSVFTDFYTDTGFTSRSYIGAVGITSAIYAFSGYEASAHMAEETGSDRMATSAAAKGVINTVLATGFGGLLLLLGLFFAMTDINQTLSNDQDLSGPATGNAAVNLFILATGRHMGGFLASLVTINLFFAGLASVGVTGRITFALARDNAFPCSSLFSELSPVYKSPVNALIVVCALDSVLQLLPLDEENGTIVFTTIVGLCNVGFQLSYAIPIFLKVYYNPSHFPRTECDLGIWSRPFGSISCMWLLATSALLFFPDTYPVELKTMNWLFVIFIFVFTIGTINWRLNSRYHFTGPKRLEDQKIAVNAYLDVFTDESILDFELEMSKLSSSPNPILAVGIHI